MNEKSGVDCGPYTMQKKGVLSDLTMIFVISTLYR